MVVNVKTLRKVENIYPESFKMSCCTRMEKISWTDRVGNAEVLQRVKEKRNTIHAAKRRKANWIGHVLCRNFLLKQIIEGKMEGSRNRVRRHGQVLHDKEKTGCCKLKQEAADR
jgi:ribosomal 50S subunit-associated protein YjgA (DUF615 family)